MLLLAMGSAAGLGGGTVVFPTLLVVFGFSPNLAVPMSIIIVFFTTSTKSAKEIFERSPEKDKDKPLIDFNLAIIFLVPVIFGTGVGVWINSITPNIYLYIFTAVLLFVLGIDSYNKAGEYKKKELEEREKE